MLSSNGKNLPVFPPRCTDLAGVTADPSSWMGLLTCTKKVVAVVWGTSNVRAIVNTYMPMDSLLYVVIQRQELTSLSLQYSDLAGVTADPSFWMSLVTCIKKAVATVWGASKVEVIGSRNVNGFLALFCRPTARTYQSLCPIFWFCLGQTSYPLKTKKGSGKIKIFYRSLFCNK